MRRLSLKLHLWLGLAAAFFLLVEGVTGALMTWGPELVNLANAVPRRTPPPKYQVNPSPTRLPLAELVRQLRERHPDLHLNTVRFGAAPDQPWIADFDGPHGSRQRTWIDPSTGLVLGEQSATLRAAWLLDLTRSAGRLHGDVPAGAALLVIAVSGLILWWPRRILRLRTPLSPFRTTYQLHAMVGFYASLLLLTFAGTGVVMGMPRVSMRFLGWLTNTTPMQPVPRPRSRSTAPAAPIDLDQAFALAVADRKPSDFTMLQWLNDRTGLVAFLYRTPGVNGRVIVELANGRVREFLQNRELAGPERFVQMVREVHTGEIYGHLSRWIAGACGFLLALLALTGPLIWWFGRRAESQSGAES